MKKLNEESKKIWDEFLIQEHVKYTKYTPSITA